MPRFALVALLFLAIPLIELSILIRVGSVIGVGWTLGLVVLTAIIGVWLLRIQGLSTLRRAQLTLDEGGLPALELLEGVALLIAGALLLTPGFATDAFGFALLLPQLRRAVLARIARRLVARAAENQDRRPPPGPGQPPPRQGEIIDGDYRRED